METVKKVDLYKLTTCLGFDHSRQFPMIQLAKPLVNDGTIITSVGLLSITVIV